MSAGSTTSPAGQKVKLVLATAQLLLVAAAFIASQPLQVLGFHLSFGQRFLKSASNPQLNPASTLIRPIECRNTNNSSEVGICMFSIDCMQNKGVPLSVCKHNYFVGTCCRLPDYNNFVGIVYDLRDTELGLDGRKTPSKRPALEAQQVAAASTATATTKSTSGHDEPAGTSQLAPVALPSRSELAAVITTLASPSVLAAEASRLSSLSSLSSLSVEPLEAGEKLEDKYVISATSLFPSVSAQTAPATTTTSTTLAPTGNEQQQAESSEKPDGPDRGVATQAAGVSESARNADGVAAGDSLPQSSALMLGSSGGVNIVNYQQQQQQQRLANFSSSSAESEWPQVQTSPAGKPSSHSQAAEAVVATRAPDSLGARRPGEPPALKTQQPQSSYEVVKDDSSLEVLGTITSAHSAPTTQQQFSLADQQAGVEVAAEPARRTHTTAANAEKKQQEQQQQQDSNSVYLLDEQLVGQQQQQSIVFANNHQQSTTVLMGSSVHRAADQQGGSSTVQPPSTLATTQPPTKSGQQQQQAAGDQEFTLASVSSAPSTGPPGADHLASAAATVAAKWLSSTVKFGEPASSSVALPSSALSTLVDLVSASNSPATQSTTPFTTSLSTALLPSVSSHYSLSAPTTPAPTANSTGSSSAASAATTAGHSSPLLVSLSSSPASPSPSQTSSSSESKPSSQRPPSSQEPSLALAFSQLYSNQHASTQSHLAAPSDASDERTAQSGGAGPRPGLTSAGGAHQPASVFQAAATKIVTGVSVTNNLIPSLSGLQSAILSHIPFKIASGLSSGLSSYLQAAMKPTGGRPLMSSNTAPAPQYQQQLLMMQANSSTKPPAAGSVRFPGSSSPAPPSSSSGPTSSGAPSPTAAAASSSAGSSQVSFSEQTSPSGPSSSSPVASLASWQVGGPGLSTSAPTPAHDVVQEALQVCGRPQVSHSASSPPGEAGKKRVARIVGGNQSQFGQWPWMVSLRQWRKGAFLHKCGAALLNENWAITAAHCVEKVKAADLLLRLGEFDVGNQEEPFPYIERRVKTVVAHPSFDPKTFEYDLALLRFAEPVKYERNIVPVCVPEGNDTYVDRMATVIGWGRLYEDGPLPDVIQHVDVPIITNNECEKMYRNAGYIEEIPDMFICAGISKGGRDSCEGDSGGPLTMVDTDGRSYLVGIISWGIGCALPSQPGVYTRITAFSGWINQITAL